MLKDTKMEDVLQECFGGHPHRPTFHLYGDAGYDGCAATIITPENMVDNQQRMKANSVRVSVENAFGWVKGKRRHLTGIARAYVSSFLSYVHHLHIPTHTGLWAFAKYSDQQRICNSPVGAQLRVVALLANCCNCLIPNPVSKRFGVRPPTLEDYLA